MALTLYAALVLQSYVLVLLFATLQAGAVAWYLLSYIPGGARILKFLTRGGLRMFGSVCCRGAGHGAWGSSGMLPL